MARHTYIHRLHASPANKIGIDNSFAAKRLRRASHASRLRAHERSTNEPAARSSPSVAALSPLFTMDADADTLALIAALSLADISSVHAARKGEAPAGAPQTDEELAFELCAAEAAALLALSQDAILAESIDRALQTDRAALRACAAVEAQEASDRNAALALAGQAPQTSPSYRCGEGDGEVVSVADLLERLSVCSEYVLLLQRLVLVVLMFAYLLSDDDTSTSAQASSSRTTLPPQSTPRGP